MSGKRVLIVDDEAPLRFLLSKQLIRAGFETDMAPDGASALAAAADGSFDAVVLDVVMPRMDGFEVCRRLKADPRTAGTTVLFLGLGQRRVPAARFRGGRGRLPGQAIPDGAVGGVHSG